MNKKEQEAKRKAIQDVWQETHLKYLKDQVDKDGFIICSNGDYASEETTLNFRRLRTSNIEYNEIRPYKLEGVENNNGWNFIDWEDESTLPDAEENVIWLRNEGEPPYIGSMLDPDYTVLDYENKPYYTHWRPYNILPPIY